MRAGGYLLGGEQSGHIIDLDRNTTGDGPMTAIAVLSTMVLAGTSLRELSAGLRVYPQILLNVRMPAGTAPPRSGDRRGPLGDRGRRARARAERAHPGAALRDRAAAARDGRGPRARGDRAARRRHRGRDRGRSAGFAAAIGIGRPMSGLFARVAAPFAASSAASPRQRRRPPGRRARPDRSSPSMSRRRRRRSFTYARRYRSGPGPSRSCIPSGSRAITGRSGPLPGVVGLRVSANGSPLEWRRDLVDFYAIHTTVPSGAATSTWRSNVVDAPPAIGEEPPRDTANLVIVQWSSCLVYPQGAKADAAAVSLDVTFRAAGNSRPRCRSAPAPVVGVVQAGEPHDAG